ncbi:hypothetical protein BUALT_Bualt18G0121600 [Buddleja alternifolia]|uniref:FCP1 homology domain-containing protein n=1 Tax=Buddleja alternifolia TaxID=168488 RepID=A0AAV6WF67_9LAMI|nr:hypothetical protein BUALT_Bualt18G0121600 [Buddleja alternifolia]
MPSLKMKTKSTTGWLKDKNGLHICRKSTMISKNPLSSARVAHNAEEFGSFTQSSLDGSVYDKVYVQDLGRKKANHDDLSNEAEKFPTHQSTETDFETVNRMEPTTSTCTSNTETIFPPIFDSMDFHNNKGSDELYVFHLDSEESSSRSLCEYPACSVSDFYFSDMIFSGSNSLFHNEMDTIFLPDFKWEDSSLLCHLTEEYMELPFLKDASDTGCDHQDRSSEETIADADMAIHQLRSYKPDYDVNTYLDPDYECFDPLMYIRNLLEQPDMAFNLSTLTLNGKHNTKQITLVLDLDETLVHSTLDCCGNADFTFTSFFDMKEHTVYVKCRPHLETFLKRVAEMFEIVVFTASQSIYANPLLDILDPDGKLISRRAYRDSCIVSEGTYTKDLTVLGVDLAKVAIIDNSPQVFRLQVNNGIPIKSWFDDPSDCALISLLPFLETLVDADDVRPIIARKFGNKE